MRRGLYYSYTITSQSYSSARPISGSNGLNEPDAAVKPADAAVNAAADAAADAAAEPADATTDAEYYTGSDASFRTTNYRQ